MDAGRWRPPRGAGSSARPVVRERLSGHQRTTTEAALTSDALPCLGLPVVSNTPPPGWPLTLEARRGRPQTSQLAPRPSARPGGRSRGRGRPLLSVPGIASPPMSFQEHSFRLIWPRPNPKIPLELLGVGQSYPSRRPCCATQHGQSSLSAGARSTANSASVRAGSAAGRRRGPWVVLALRRSRPSAARPGGPTAQATRSPRSTHAHTWCIRRSKQAPPWGEAPCPPPSGRLVRPGAQSGSRRARPAAGLGSATPRRPPERPPEGGGGGRGSAGPLTPAPRPGAALGGRAPGAAGARPLRGCWARRRGALGGAAAGPWRGGRLFAKGVPSASLSGLTSFFKNVFIALLISERGGEGRDGNGRGSRCPAASRRRQPAAPPRAPCGPRLGRAGLPRTQPSLLAGFFTRLLTLVPIAGLVQAEAAPVGRELQGPCGGQMPPPTSLHRRGGVDTLAGRAPLILGHRNEL